jgi:hypothetical protein
LLKSLPSKYYLLTIGKTTSQKGWGIGGSTQYELEYTLPASAYKNLKELP